MDLNIKKAVRTQRKARILLAAPSGGGKTMTAIRLAKGLVGNGKVLLLDTEKGSATLYADTADFDHADLPNTDWDTYLAAIKQATTVKYDALIIDSASHAWESLLAEKERMPGNSYTNWAKITPKYEALVNAILGFSGHIIVTVRAKMSYEIGDDKKVKPVGLSPVMRDGFEYEFDFYGMLDIEHNMTVRKSRIDKFAGKIITKPDEDVGMAIASWLASGKAPEKQLYKISVETIKPEQLAFMSKVSVQCKNPNYWLAEKNLGPRLEAFESVWTEEAFLEPSKDNSRDDSIEWMYDDEPKKDSRPFDPDETSV